MAYRLRDTASALKVITTGAWKVRDENNVLRTIKEAKARDPGGVLRTYYTQLTAAIIPTYDYADTKGMYGFPSGMNTVYFSMIPAGGTAPFTYLWVRASGSSLITSVPVTADTGYFTTSFSAAGTRQAYWQAKITDAEGQIAFSPQLKITLTALDYT